MKRFSVFFIKAAFILLLCAVLFAGCGKKDKPSPDALDKDTSYAFGMAIAMQIGLGEFSFDYNALAEGFRDVNEEKETRLTPDEAMDKINVAISKFQAQHDEKMWLEGEKLRAEGEDYLAGNKNRPGVITTASGLQYEVMTQGSGAKPEATDMVRVHYEGALINGTVFDSSFSRGEPIEFPLNGVIPGWSEGVQLMNEGSTYRLYIPFELAYGPSGIEGFIPPFSALVFTVELISIIKY